MFVIVESGGKQYRVEKDALVQVDRMAGNVGDNIVMDSVLLVSDNENIQVGQPVVEGAKVTASITRQGKDKKIIVYKYLRRKGSSRKIGHRRQYTELKITGINL